MVAARATRTSLSRPATILFCASVFSHAVAAPLQLPLEARVCALTMMISMMVMRMRDAYFDRDASMNPCGMR